jgi:hypothetical protein
MKDDDGRLAFPIGVEATPMYSGDTLLLLLLLTHRSLSKVKTLVRSAAALLAAKESFSRASSLL